MRVIYFPGFGGGINSTGSRTILKKYPDALIVQYNNHDAVVAAAEIESQIHSLLPEQPLIVGQSLGGFWAEYFAIKYALDLVLINPSIEPYVSMVKYNEITGSTLESYKLFETQEKAKDNVSIILSKQDDIVDASPVREKYAGIAKFTEVEGTHIFREYGVMFGEMEGICRV